jgi:hypothetical protein
LKNNCFFVCVFIARLGFPVSLDAPLFFLLLPKTETANETKSKNKALVFPQKEKETAKLEQHLFLISSEEC